MNSEAISRNISQLWKYAIPSLEDGIKSLNKKIIALEKRINQCPSTPLDPNGPSNPNLPSDIESTLRSYEEAIVLNRDAIQTLINRLNDLQSWTTEQDSNLIEQTNNINDSINDIIIRTNSLSDELSSLSNTLENLRVRLESLENGDQRISEIQTGIGNINNSLSALQFIMDERLKELETLDYPDYAFIMNVVGGYPYEDNVFEPTNTEFVVHCANDLGTAGDMLREADFETIDVNKEFKFGYLYIPNEFMLFNTLNFINKVNNFFEEYKNVHGDYPCFKSGLNLLVHSRELSYHANYGAANGHPEYKDYLRTLMKHVNRICILGQAHQNKPMYTDMNNLQFERLNSWNGAYVGIPIFTDSTVKTIDFDTSFGWDYIHLAINFFNDEGRENYKFAPCIRNIRFPSDAKIIGVKVEFYDHTGELYHCDDGIEWEVAENSWLETIDLPANAWKCDLTMPINTLKNVYLPTNPDVLNISPTLIHSPFKKADHINYRRSIHNGLDFNYALYSNTFTVCDEIQSGDSNGEIYRTKNVVELLSNGKYKNYVEVKDLVLGNAGTPQEPGAFSYFHYSDYANYDSNYYRTLFDRDFYYDGGFYYNVLHEKFINDAADDYEHRYSFRIPFNNRFETLVFDMENFKNTSNRGLQFRFAAPSLMDSESTVKQNCFKRLVVTNADYLDYVNLESRVEPNPGEEVIDNVLDSIPHMLNWYASLIYLHLPPCRELRIDMVHPVHLLQLDLTKFERTEIQNLYLDEKCIIKVNSFISTQVLKIYYTSEDKKPKFVSDLLTEEELQTHFYSKCELLPFSQ